MNLKRAFLSTWTKTVYARRIARDVLPKTAAELKRWHRHIIQIPNLELQQQAWVSITKKRFHAEGGSVYAALAPDAIDTLVPLIVALQTISDYLDNLCDRSVSLDEADFRTLHEAMLDAVDGTPPQADHSTPPQSSAENIVPAPNDTHNSPWLPTGAGRGLRSPVSTASHTNTKHGSVLEPSRYYTLHPNKDDGGYLAALVDECRRRTAELPAYDVVRPHVQRLVSLYNDLQVYKHGPHAGRVARLEAWFAEKGGAWRDLYWWEFAAASGSTLGVFALFTAATNPDLTPTDAERIVEAYFPWICGLHILLDYLIDQEEDVAGGDLNLVSFYPDKQTMRERLIMFVRKARRHALTLSQPDFHTTIVQGLPGLYLSDGKVSRQRMQRLALTLLRAGGAASFGYYLWCRLRRIMDPAYT